MSMHCSLRVHHAWRTGTALAGSPFRRLASLRDQGRFGAYCLLAGTLAFGISVTLGALTEIFIYAFALQPEAVPRRNLDPNEKWLVFGVVVFAPLLETVLYRWVLSILARWMSLPLALSSASVLAGSAHGPYPSTFVAVSGAFGLYALAWHHWRQVSPRKSYWAPAIAHAISNGILVGIALSTFWLSETSTSNPSNGVNNAHVEADFLVIRMAPLYVNLGR